MKKWSLLLSLLLMGSIFLSACSGSSSESAGGEITLTFWNGFTGPDGAEMKKIVDRFNQEHKGKIRVVTQTMQWRDYYDKIRTVVAAGKAPDVAVMHVDQLPRMAKKGVLMPLDPYLSEVKLDKSDFIPAVWSAGEYEGKRYGIPIDVHPIGLYYNVDLLKQAGFDKPPATWEEFVKVAKATTKDTDGDGKTDQWGIGVPTLWPGHLLFFSLLHQKGGQPIDAIGTKATFNDQKGVEALQFMKDLIYKEKVSPANIQLDGEVTLFKQGKAAMHINGIWMINGFKEQKGLNFAVAPLPQFEGGIKATWASSHNLVIPRQKKPDKAKVQAAMKFISYLTENSIPWAKAGQIPARNSVRNSPEFQALKEQAELAKQVDYLVFPPAVPSFVDLWSQVERGMNKALLNQADPKAALDEAAAKGEKQAQASN